MTKKPDAATLDDPSFLAPITPFYSSEAAESAGQRALVLSTALPTEGLHGRNREAWEAMGLKIGAVASPDSLFVDVELPTGWHMKATEHAMWSDLLDGKGRKRGAIFYKAAFYDRRASIRPICRFSIDQNFDIDDVQFQVRDQGVVVFSSSTSQRPSGADRAEQYKAIDEALRGECEAWLAERGHPDYKNPAAYWD